MEEPGSVTTQPVRIKYFTNILSLLFLLLLMVSVSLCCNQNKMSTKHSIKGIIQNSAGRPVADAVVMIKDGSYEFPDIASVSNELGEFFVSGIVIPGRYVLMIKHDTATITKEINVQSADTVIHINL